MATAEQLRAKIAAIEEEAKQKKAKAQRALARLEAKEKNAVRRVENRKKMLVGAFILDQLEKCCIVPKDLTFEGKSFADWLTRENERELFGIASQPKTD
ncbi:hypothetical protein KIK84_16280 [Curvibacter sp. CHRR-16]|uniref:hypothetical protein n=1 Tax=Curvibacter sp. CHRR-16 TaxID=2835872 RepID=UPI001BDA1D56|nr:hypothetical protein [Curvibacter sp. CHRR-16]MBT0571873.1 hypothetical protein [Curvibacter sp. CHRR-16]